MNIEGNFSKEGRLWVIDIPLLDLLLQSPTKREIKETIIEAIELLVNKSEFKVTVTITTTGKLFVSSSDAKLLTALMLKRQRQKIGLTLEEVRELLNAKSVNEYAQYEQGKSLPSIEKFQEFMTTFNPDHVLYLALS